MGQLAFIGLGLGDDRDLSSRAREVLQGCDVVFFETYTSLVAAGTFERIARELGRPVLPLTRVQLESERPILEALTRYSHVGLLVAGDPFAATTHVALRLAAEAAGHSWTYLPNASIVSAAPGFLGLQQYRFGRIVSIPFPEPGFTPRSPLDGIAQNRAQDLHTLVLLDLRPADGRFLTAPEALGLLTDLDSASNPPVLAPELSLAVVARVGTDSARAWYGPRSRLATVDFGPPLHALVVPGRTLHFEEKAALARIELDENAVGD